MRALAEHRAHRQRAVGEALGGGDEVGHHAEIVGGEGRAEAAEAGDDLVEDQQDAVLVADRAQALEVALRRHQHAGGAGHRLDDAGRDGLGVVQRDEALEVVGELGAVLGQAPREGVALGVMRVAQVVDARQQREDAAVVDDAAHRDAAEADAVIAALAPDQLGARALADGALVGERDLQGGVDGFGAGAGEEHPVEAGLRAARRDGGEALGEVEGRRMAHLERGREVEGGELALDRRGDALAPMPGIHAPEAGGAVEDAAPVRGRVVHALGRGEQAGRRLELPVGRERHPVGVEPGGIGGVVVIHGDPPVGTSMDPEEAPIARNEQVLFFSARCP